MPEALGNRVMTPTRRSALQRWLTVSASAACLVALALLAPFLASSTALRAEFGGTPGAGIMWCGVQRRHKTEFVRFYPHRVPPLDLPKRNWIKDNVNRAVKWMREDELRLSNEETMSQHLGIAHRCNFSRLVEELDEQVDMQDLNAHDGTWNQFILKELLRSVAFYKTLREPGTGNNLARQELYFKVDRCDKKSYFYALYLRRLKIVELHRLYICGLYMTLGSLSFVEETPQLEKIPGTSIEESNENSRTTSDGRKVSSSSSSLPSSSDSSDVVAPQRKGRRRFKSRGEDS